MEDIRSQFRDSLVSDPPEIFCSVWILDRIPVIFADQLRSYAQWRQTLASKLGVDPCEVRITGSAVSGVSLNPNKNFKLFDDSSDIDVSVISSHHFDLSWRALRSLGSTLHRLPPPAKESVKDHVGRLIYWGTIATDRILHLLPFGKEWNKALEEMAQISPTINREIKVRVYKDFQSLRAYQINNITSLRTAQLEE